MFTRQIAFNMFTRQIAFNMFTKQFAFNMLTKQLLTCLQNLWLICNWFTNQCTYFKHADKNIYC